MLRGLRYLKSIVLRSVIPVKARLLQGGWTILEKHPSFMPFDSEMESFPLQTPCPFFPKN